jgi:hypothetical protein
MQNPPLKKVEPKPCKIHLKKRWSQTHAKSTFKKGGAKTMQNPPLKKVEPKPCKIYFT